ncbi:MAG TPA: hypothetical protein PLJ60_01320 [Chryseolinea sp.]|nr:hypothetical protein [Chryseolinea sp.]HPM28946.1 hypothetical protein [Chryseolinea sp.]
MKYFIVLGLVVYIIYKISSFFFRAGAASQELNDLKRKQNQTPPKTKKSKLEGGEYVDYEEVK